MNRTASRMLRNAVGAVVGAVVVGPLAAQEAPPNWAQRNVTVEYGLNVLGVGVFRPAFLATNPNPVFRARVGARITGGLFAELRTVRGLTDRVDLDVQTLATTANQNRFYGFGNETVAPEHSVFYQLEQLQLTFRPSLVWRTSRITTLSGGWFVQRMATDMGMDGDDDPGEPNDGGIIASLQPYGAGRFDETGFFATARIATPGTWRETPAAFRGRSTVTLFPAALDVTSTFWRVDADVGTRLSPPSRVVPTLLNRVRAQRVIGIAPYHEAAFLGGRRNLRGFDKQRFAGDAMFTTRTELVWDVVPQFTVFGRAITLGPLLFADVGRVWMDYTASDRWHVGTGGGLWLQPADSPRIVKVTVSHSVHGVRAYAFLGLPVLP